MRKSVDLVNEGDESGDDVLEAVHALMHLVRARQFRGQRDVPQAVTPVEARVVRFFARRPGATQSELVEHSGRDKGQLARLVAGLRERGLLEARADEADRRSLRLYLTADGRAADQALRRRTKRLSALAVKGFDAAERRQLLDLLARVRANLEAADS